MKTDLVDIIVALIVRLADDGSMTHPDPYARLYSATRMVEAKIMQLGVELNKAKERKTCF
jgi:hypothetical protein